MPRTKINLPTTFQFTTKIEVRIDDINYAGHLSNDRVLTLVHEARVRFLCSLGFTELDVDGSGTIMTDAAVVYKAEAFQGDRLRIDVAVTDLTRYGCDFYFRLREEQTGQDVAHAKTGLAFYDYEKKKLQRTPEKFRAGLLSIFKETNNAA